MRTWWEVADEVRGGVVRAREWWIENETAAIKCRLVSAGERQSLHVVDVQTDRRGFWKQACFWKNGKMNRYSYNLASRAARRRTGVIRSRTYRPRLVSTREKPLYDADRGKKRSVRF
jgi:hypothetical protein